MAEFELRSDSSLNENRPGEKHIDNTTDEINEEDYPDGGFRAWLVAAGTAGVFFCTMGYSNVFGIFQAYYIADAISWIGATQTFLQFFSGILGGPLFDRYGTWVIRPAAVVYVFSIMMTSLCTKYWQFMLAQRILTGLSNGLVMFPSMTAVTQWFDKKRGAAMGASIACSSLGAVIFPVLLANLLTRTDVSFGWSVRIAAFVMVPILAFSSSAIKCRLPPRKTHIITSEPFRQPMYLFIVAAIAFCMVGMFVPLFLMTTYAITKGMDATLASYLVAILNGASIFGRVIPGILADKLGKLNMLIAAGLSTGILCFSWPLTETTTAIVVFVAILGFCSGAILSGGPIALTVCIKDPKSSGMYMGLGMAMASVAALVGPPIAGALVDNYGFKEVSHLSGGMTLAGALIGIIAKYKSPEGVFGRI
ncbi:unnamed protein product [Clonostachys rosea]|uniref:Major facilitator superfamily (MFS) profile domain-containing protein n=1 Tax=Bionectria ochroleuca TaxID=29856 RepID=A0ABY6TUR4_BIOOC|nr:unnamed protein product [Clonostachys rosea]